MTVIFSTEACEGKLLFGGDIVVSVENSVGGRNITLPLLPAVCQFSTKNGEISDLRQKICRITENLYVLWAGSSIAARAIIEIIRKTEYPGDLLEGGLILLLSQSGLSSDELESVSLIVILVIPEFSVEMIHYNCDEYHRKYASYIAAGTGAWHMFNYLSGEQPQSIGHDLGNIIFDVNERIIRQTLSEGLTQETLEFFYGGRIQLFFASKYGVEHVTPTIKIWDRKGDKLYSLPAYICNQLGDDFIITICDPGDVHGLKAMHQFSVPQLDHPYRRFGSTKQIFEAGFPIYHVITSDINDFVGYITQTTEEDYSINYHCGGFIETVNPSFIERINKYTTDDKACFPGFRL